MIVPPTHRHSGELLMIGYVTLGTNDLPKAVAFYDALFGSIGIGRFMEQPDYFVAWVPAPDAPSVAVTKPFDKQAATVGNGVMVALFLRTRAEVDALYAKALELGATSEGAPGPRGEAGGFYAGYFRDLDDNKLNAFCVEKA
jgi:predicted lactoylglutathione lyase